MHIPGQERAGRYVIIQMDNDEERLNLREVKAFGRWISTPTSTSTSTSTSTATSTSTVTSKASEGDMTELVNSTL